MKSYVLKPLQSIGNIVFGQERHLVRQELGAYTEFRKTKSGNTTDDFGPYQVFYDAENCCEAVEFSPKASRLLIDNICIDDLSYSELSEYLESRDPNAEKSADSVTSHTLGISVYAPNGSIETILFFKKGYFYNTINKRELN